MHRTVAGYNLAVDAKHGDHRRELRRRFRGCSINSVGMHSCG